MKHLREEELILHYYGEDAGNARTDLERHLADCAECRAAFATIERLFAAVNAVPVPERGEAYGAEVWRRLAPRLDESRSAAWFDWLRVLPPQRLAVAGALVVLLIVAFLLGRISHQPASPETAGPTVEQVRERLLVVAVTQHLERAQMLLTELMNNAPSTGRVDLAADQRRAEELVRANRLYRQTAAQVGETPVASVLDELERTLVEIANSPPEVSAGELARLRKSMEARGVLFKVRLIASQLREREAQARLQLASGRP